MKKQMITELAAHDDIYEIEIECDNCGTTFVGRQQDKRFECPSCKRDHTQAAQAFIAYIQMNS